MSEDTDALLLAFSQLGHQMGRTQALVEFLIDALERIAKTAEDDVPNYALHDIAVDAIERCRALQDKLHDPLHPRP